MGLVKLAFKCIKKLSRIKLNNLTTAHHSGLQKSKAKYVGLTKPK